jgi:hypothetical protein
MLDHEFVSPSEIAAELSVSPKRVRAWLRKQGWRPAIELGQRWQLTKDQATATRRKFERSSTVRLVTSGANVRSVQTSNELRVSKKANNRDAPYVLDLCDALLRVPGAREHRFDWLRGDLSPRTGRSATLPVDSFWADFSLVVEVLESQHFNATPHFDKPHIETISGVHRGEQRRRYDLRRAEQIPAHGLKLVEIKTTDFNLRGKLIDRHPDTDIEVVRRHLAKAGLLVS